MRCARLLLFKETGSGCVWVQPLATEGKIAGFDRRVMMLNRRADVVVQSYLVFGGKLIVREVRGCALGTRVCDGRGKLG